MNEGPEIAGRDPIPVSENHDGAQPLATYTGEGPEGTGADITCWSVTSRDGGDFTINPDGELTFRNTTHYERPADSNRNNEYLVTVRAADVRYYRTFGVTLTVADVNEPPDITGSDTISYRDNSTATVAACRAADPEKSAVTWSLSGADSGAFAIGNAGVLAFANPPDSGRDNVYNVTVEARDDQSNTARLEVTVTVTNLTSPSSGLPPGPAWWPDPDRHPPANVQERRDGYRTAILTSWCRPWDIAGSSTRA